MRRLEEFILEKLKISKIETNYKPKNKEELIDIIIKEIEENGPDCSLNHIDVSNITDMSCLFMGGVSWKYTDGHPVLSKFDGDISGWNVSNVTDMTSMFYNCKNFNQDISTWDVSNVTDMYGMFELCESFNQDISSWDFSNSKYRYNSSVVFNNCPIENAYKPKFK